MIPKNRIKHATLPLSASMLAMAVMFVTNEAHVTRVQHEHGIDLVFSFAAYQQFTVTFRGELLVAASLTLVEGREPSTQAMTMVDNQTDIDTVQLFDGLESNDVLKVEVVTDEGFSLDKDGVDVRLAGVTNANAVLGEVFKKLIDADANPQENLGPSLVSQRTKLAAQYRPQSQAKSQEAA